MVVSREKEKWSRKFAHSAALGPSNNQVGIIWK
jgi:hypothetical protein